MEECSYTFPQERKEELVKRLYEDKELPDLGKEKISKISYMDGCKVCFENGGGVVIRFSGTEPLLRVFCEMPTRKAVVSVCERIRSHFDI